MSWVGLDVKSRPKRAETPPTKASLWHRRCKSVRNYCGGKQYRVKQGDILQVELLAAEAGTVVQAEKVLAVGEGEALQVGNPTVAGASVSLKVLEHGKGKKVVVFHYKPKSTAKRRMAIVSLSPKYRWKLSTLN